MAAERVQFQGLPSRICWLGYGERAKFGLVMNDLVRRGEVSAPIVIGPGLAELKLPERERNVGATKSSTEPTVNSL